MRVSQNSISMATPPHEGHPLPRPLLLACLTNPSRPLRVLAAVIALGVVVNLFHHGAQPYAVGAVTPPWDKLAHIALHFVVASLLWVLFSGRHRVGMVVLCALLAVADEAAQSFMPGRSAEVVDVLASLVGALLAVSMGTLMQRALMRAPTRHPTSEGIQP